MDAPTLFLIQNELQFATHKRVMGVMLVLKRTFIYDYNCQLNPFYPSSGTNQNMPL